MSPRASFRGNPVRGSSGAVAAIQAVVSVFFLLLYYKLIVKIINNGQYIKRYNSCSLLIVQNFSE